MYAKTNWVDNETPVNAENMNKIETALEKHENGIESKLNKPEVDGTENQILARGRDGKLVYINKPADGAKGPKGDPGTAGAKGASVKSLTINVKGVTISGTATLTDESTVQITGTYSAS